MINRGNSLNDTIFQRFSKCIGCDPNFAFKDQSIIPTCKVGKSGLHECKLKCSGHGFIKGNDKTRIFCRCPKNQGKGKNCSWYHDGKKEKLKSNIEQSHFTLYATCCCCGLDLRLQFNYTTVCTTDSEV